MMNCGCQNVLNNRLTRPAKFKTRLKPRQYMKEVIRARIDGKIKEEAAAVLAEIGLTVPDAFRLMMMRIAAEKRLPFEPLIPNEETAEAMEAARRGELVTVGGLSDLMADLNADD